MVVAMVLTLIALPVIPMTSSPFLIAQYGQYSKLIIIFTDEQSPKSSFIEKLEDYKIGFNCHVEAKGFGDCSVLFLKPLSEDTYSAKWIHIWFYSDAEIIVDDRYHSGEGAIYIIGYNGRYEFNDVAHTYTIDGNALFCFAMGKNKQIKNFISIFPFIT